MKGLAAVRATTLWGLIMFAACKKSSKEPVIIIVPEPDVTIKSVMPNGGSVGNMVYIKGRGFSSTITDNKVKFNNVEASVSQSNDSLIIAVVPQNAGGPITVQRGIKTATGPTFIYVNATVTTVAGNGSPGFADGSGTLASFKNPWGITFDAQGNLYVSDNGNNVIRKITSAGVVSTLAGNGAGYVDGMGTSAKFDSPQGIVADAQGNIFVADFNNRRIRKITSAGLVTTFAGNGTSGLSDGNGTLAQFVIPSAITIDAQGTLYVSDGLRMRKITTTGDVTTVPTSPADYFGSVAGFAINMQGDIYSGELDRIRKVTPTGGVSLIANTQLYPSCSPHAVAVDLQGNIIYTHHAGIRKLTLAGDHLSIAGSTYVPLTFQDPCPGIGFSNGEGGLARFSYPKGVVVDTQGNIYVSDNNCIRKIVIR